MADDEIPIGAPEEALRYFRAKGLEIGFAWQDVWQAEHARAFTVAKAMTRDLLEDIRAAVDAAIAKGQTLAEFSKALRPTLEAKGWWGRKTMIDPLTAERKTVQLGSPRRLRTIYRVNMRTAYQAGRWERIQRQKTAFPLLRYTSIMDGREREEHRAWHDTVLPVDHEWWDTHYPPCGWNCRCTAVAMNARQVEKRGLAVTKEPVTFPSKPWTNSRTGEEHQVEEGIDPGWSYNVGKAALAGLAPRPIGGGFGGADIAAAADPLMPFFAAFGIVDPVRGAVIEDAVGWPLAISQAWFRDAGGRVVLPAPPRRAELAIAAAAIARPSEIRWVWVSGKDGQAMLFRRYLAIEAGEVRAAVDIGAAGWRWQVGADDELAKLRRGTIAWPVELAAIAAYNPYQPRDPKGSRSGGQFRSSGISEIFASARAPSNRAAPMARLGNTTPAVLAKIKAVGLNPRSPAVWLETSAVRHALNRHGGDKLPVTERQIRGVRGLLASATAFRKGRKRGDVESVEVERRTSRTVTTALFEVRRRGLVFHTMRRKSVEKDVSPS